MESSTVTLPTVDLTSMETTHIQRKETKDAWVTILKNYETMLMKASLSTAAKVVAIGFFLTCLIEEMTNALDSDKPSYTALVEELKTEFASQAALIRGRVAGLAVLCRSMSGKLRTLDAKFFTQSTLLISLDEIQSKHSMSESDCLELEDALLPFLSSPSTTTISMSSSVPEEQVNAASSSESSTDSSDDQPPLKKKKQQLTLSRDSNVCGTIWKREVDGKNCYCSYPFDTEYTCGTCCYSHHAYDRAFRGFYCDGCDMTNYILTPPVKDGRDYTAFRYYCVSCNMCESCCVCHFKPCRVCGYHYQCGSSIGSCHICNCCKAHCTCLTEYLRMFRYGYYTNTELLKAVQNYRDDNECDCE